MRPALPSSLLRLRSLTAMAGLTVLASHAALAGCGGRAASSAPAQSASGASGAERAEAVADEEDVGAEAASAPCTQWDPAGDPLAPPADVAAPPETARRGADGLRFCILRQGTGALRPSRVSRVRVHYTGWTTDGRMFDSSRARGEPATFGVTEVIRGWTDALTHMTVGQVRRVWIPEELAYRGAEGAPAGMLVFDIELLAIE